MACFEGPTPPANPFFGLICLECLDIITVRLSKYLESMARRRHSIAIEGAEGTAKRTIQHLEERVKEAQADPAIRDRWLSKYFDNLQNYAEDPIRTAAAEAKLTTWYQVVEENVAPEFSRAMSSARAEYYKRLSEKYRKLAEEETKNTERPGYVSRRI